MLEDREPDKQPKRFILDSHLSIKSNLEILQQENVFIVYGDDPNNNLSKLNKY